MCAGFARQISRTHEEAELVHATDENFVHQQQIVKLEKSLSKAQKELDKLDKNSKDINVKLKLLSAVRAQKFRLPD